MKFGCSEFRSAISNRIFGLNYFIITLDISLSGFLSRFFFVIVEIVKMSFTLLIVRIDGVSSDMIIGYYYS